MAKFNISSLLIHKKEVEFEYPYIEGFKVTLTYLSKDEVIKMRNKHTSQKFNNELEAMLPQLDEEGFKKEWVGAVVHSWSGLTCGKLAQMILVDESAFEDPESEVEYSVENAESLMIHCNTFDRWINSMLSNIDNFRTK